MQSSPHVQRTATYAILAPMGISFPMQQVTIESSVRRGQYRRLLPTMQTQQCFQNALFMAQHIKGAHVVCGEVLFDNVGVPIEHYWIRIGNTYYDPTFARHPPAFTLGMPIYLAIFHMTPAQLQRQFDVSETGSSVWTQFIQQQLSHAVAPTVVTTL